MSIAAILLLSLLLFFVGLGDVPFFTKGEPREAVQVWDEVHRGNWILPLRNGTEVPSKPPLFHWLGGLVSLAFGEVDETTVRLPSAILATIALLCVFAFGRWQWGTSAGLCAALILATNFEWIRAARDARVDMTLTACTSIALLAMASMVSSHPRPRFAWVVMYVFAALACLAKGPIGIALPALVAIAYFALRRDRDLLRNLHPVLGCLIAVGVPALWYIVATLVGGETFVEKQILQENLFRFLGKGDVGSVHSHPFYYHFFSLFGGFAPWSLFLPAVIVYLYRRRGDLRGNAESFLCVWALAVFVFYSLMSGKRTVYILPMYPALALLMGAWWARIRSEGVRGASWLRPVTMSVASVLAVGVAICAVIIITELCGLSTLELIAPLLHSRDQANLGLVSEALSGAMPSVLSALLLLITASTSLVLFAHRRNLWGMLVGIVLFVTGVSTIGSGVVLKAVADGRSLKPFMEEVRNRTSAVDHIILFGSFDYGAVFYAHRYLPQGAAPLEGAIAGNHAEYVLLWEDVWEQLTAEDKGLLVPQLTSEESGPDHDRMIFAQVKAAP